MSSGLPATFDPLRLADEGRRLVGSLPIKACTRLVQAGVRPTGTVEVGLQFRRTGQGARQLETHLATELRVTCQRCLEELRLPLKLTPTFYFVGAEAEAGSIPEESELIVVDRPLVLADFVEDELLLALPMIPMHTEAECRAHGFREVPDGDPASENPFAMLAKIKNKPRE